MLRLARVIQYVGLVLMAISVLALLPHNNLLAQENNCNPGLRTTFEWPNTDFCMTGIDIASEVIGGGPGKDGISAIAKPQFESIESARVWLQAQSPVIALEINGDARAYPLSIMTWHEVANDVIGDVPVTVTYCPLCNSAIVFDSRVDGEALTFGVSGNLRNSDLIMYDRQTESWWQQFTGEAIVGEHHGKLLEILPSQLVAFEQFAQQFPDGQVLSQQTPLATDALLCPQQRPQCGGPAYTQRYGNNPYIGYDSNLDPFLFFGETDDRLPTVERVLAGKVNDVPIAYPSSVLAEEKVINDTVGGIDVVAIFTPGVASSLDQRVIDNSRDVGSMALFKREANGMTLTFNIDANGVVTDEETGSVWNAFGVAVGGELEGAELEQIIAAPHFWFAWIAFEPETEVYGI